MRRLTFLFGLTLLDPSHNFASFAESTDSHGSTSSTVANSRPAAQHKKNLRFDQNNTAPVSEKQVELEDDLRCFSPLSYPFPEPETSSRPIINLGLPKIGSKSLREFFECGGLPTVHHVCPRTVRVSFEGSTQLTRKCGGCIREFIQKGNSTSISKTPLAACSKDAEAIMKMDVTMPGTKDGCFWPQVSALDVIHEEYPNATFLLPQRNVRSWVRSMESWQAKIPLRMQLCGLLPSNEELVAKQQTPSDALQNFYCDHINRVRRFVNDHPTHQLVEFDLEDKRLGELLQNLVGVHESCWGGTNVNTRMAA